MKPDAHLEKARRIENSIKKLDHDRDWEMIVEGAYGAALHYIACISESKVRKHRETHKGLARFLDENNLTDLAKRFRELELLRQSRWYGSKKNGEVSKKALAALDGIEREVRL